MSEIERSYAGLVRHFAGTVVRTRHGKALLTVWGAYLVWLVALPRRKSLLAKARAQGQAQGRSSGTDGDVASKDSAPGRKAPKAGDRGLKELVKLLRPHRKCPVKV